MVSAPHDVSGVAMPVEQMAERVATLLASFENVTTPRMARENAETLVQTIVDLYGNGLERILEIVYEHAGDRADATFDQLVRDPFVESLLCLHNLHPVAVEDRVQAALDSVRPYLESHEGGVDIAGIEDGVVLLRLEGSCDGCPSSAATVKLAVEKAILERVPEIREVRALGVEAGVAAGTAATTLKVQSDWIALDGLAGFAASGSALATHVVTGTPTLFVRFDETVYAYRNSCPKCKQTLDDGLVARPLLTCSGCGHAFDVVHAGRAAGAGPSAEPFPLTRDGDRVRVAIPLGA